MYARSLLGGLHAEHVLPRDKVYAGRRSKKDWQIHVSTDRNPLNKNTRKHGKHRAKTVRCFPLLSAFGSLFGLETFSRLLRARK